LLAACAAAAGCGRLHFDARSATADGGDAPTSDVGAIDTIDGPPQPTCTALALADDFSATSTSSQWNPFIPSPMTVVQTGGQLVITLAANTAASRYGGYVAAANYDMREHCVYVTCVSPPSQSASTEVDFTLKSGTNNYTGYALVSNQVQAFNLFGSTNTTLASDAYNPAMPIVMRLRETGGTLYFEYSLDGTSFTTQFSAADPVPMDVVAPLIQAGTFGSTANPGTAVFDNFDLP
jgi:hypothetical protein